MANVNLSRYGPSIGTGLACIGVVATGVLSARAMAKYIESDIYPGEERKEFLKCFALPIAVGMATIGTFCAVRYVDKKTIAGLGASVAALSTQLSQTKAAIEEEYGEEALRKVENRVNKMRMIDDDDVIILDPDGALYFEETTGIKFVAYSERVKEAAYKINRNYQIRGGFASLYEYLRMLGIKKKDISDRDLDWTKYIGWHAYWLIMDDMSWIDYISYKDNTIPGMEDYILLSFFTPLMPICTNPPDKVHMLCHTDEEDLSELELDKDDVDTEISMEIKDNYVE